MIRILITLLLAMVCSLSSHAKKTVVWEKPYTIYGLTNSSCVLTVTRMELKTDETIMHLNVKFTPRNWIRFVKESVLKTDDGKEYAITGGEPTNEIESRIEPDSLFWMPESGEANLALHFKPLPMNTIKVDFIEGHEDGAFRLLNICDAKNVTAIYEGTLSPSYWRNETTGNWDIAFFDDCVIYDSKFWNYQNKPDTNGKVGNATFIICNGNDELEVTVGKDKKCKRIIKIGKEKGLYSMITGTSLPDYPTRDTRLDFIDNGYKRDTVTLTGWLRNMPEGMRQKKAFDISAFGGFTMDPEMSYGDIDSLGRFTVKIPVVNSTEIFGNWDQCSLRTVIEPGKSYFYLCDFKDGRQYFMGDDVRVQNELLRYPAYWESIRMEEGGDLDKYVALTDSLVSARNNMYDSLYVEHPMLSARFLKYSKGNSLWQFAFSLGQARYYMPKFQLSDKARRYAYEEFWKHLPKSLNIHRGLWFFLHDYIDDLSSERARTLMVTSLDDLFDKRIHLAINVLDSLGTDDYIRSSYLANMLYSRIDVERRPLKQSLIDSVSQWIKYPVVMDKVMAMNEKYIAIANREFDKLVMKSNDGVRGISEGEAILRKIMEPFKGKLVLLDVWGTWCAPCNMALSKSAEEYARLAPYDIAYVYLANNSPQESWENVIKEYNITGDNVAHYNLPAEQQHAVEKYLKVAHYPTYRLFDKNGNLLDLKVDARNLNSLEELIKGLDK